MNQNGNIGPNMITSGLEYSGVQKGCGDSEILECHILLYTENLPAPYSIVYTPLTLYFVRYDV